MILQRRVKRGRVGGLAAEAEVEGAEAAMGEPRFEGSRDAAMHRSVLANLRRQLG
jgi:hypothetical protein